MAGRKDKIQKLRGSRIAIAILVGILIGCVCSVLFPNGFFNSGSSSLIVNEERLSKSTSKVGLASCESSERVKMLKSDFAIISQKNAELRKQVRELTEKVRLAEQGTDNARKQVLVLGSEIKAGSFGTVKSLRTNPTVIPDESVNPRLAKLLENVAVNKEIIVVLANSNVKPMLELQIASIKRVGIQNYLIVALDDSIESFCESKEVAYYKRDPDKAVDMVGKSGGNHAVSGLKFRVLREFLQLGYGVLLSDVDIVFLQNPFGHLYRDSDVESMSDGHDNMTAYGFNDVFDEPSMGWARYAHTMRIWVFNSGFFYLRPTLPSIELLDRVADTLSKSEAWDQAVFNEQLFYPSHPGYTGLHASKRVMDMYEFMNSKVLFKTVRKNHELKKLKPVIVHLNYHPDKLERMQAVVEFYVNGKQDALDSFPDVVDSAYILPPVKKKTLPSSETVLLGSNSAPPVLRNPGGDDVDIDFGDVFGGPPKRRSKVTNSNQVTRHSFSESALRRRDVIVDVGSLIPQDEKPVFGEETSVRRRFTTDDFFDDIFRVNESSSLPGSRILSPAHKPESSGTSSPAQFSLPAKATEIPTFGLATRSLSKNKETVSSSPLSRTSSKADMVSTAKSFSEEDCDDPPRVVVTGKGRQFHFSIYKWPNKGVPVVIWGSSRLSSMSKAEETTPVPLSDHRKTSVEKSDKNEEGEGESGLSGLKEEKKTSLKRPGVQTEEEKTETDLKSKQAFSGVSKAHEATTVKSLHSILHENDERQGEKIVSEREVRKGKSKAKNTQSFTEDSRTKKKPQGTKSSLDSSPIPDKSSFASSSAAPEVGKDGVKGKVSDFVKIFSKGASVGAGGESLGQSSRWRAKETPKTDINLDAANAKETVNIPHQQKKSTPDIPAMNQKKGSDQESMNYKAPGVTVQEERQEPSTTHTNSENIDEPFHVEDITQDENKKMEETNKDAEEIQNIDAKIRKWSSGKSGNIRSLLSTLQYILWSGSGWKPVPLMDMIEGNAVRKSYQRALLILHPDKLQQKGASANQKYIAEKVFELLQEAWDHFNSLGPV
ncbi:unnamed protein product [Arabidopsis arenosa]|uniref:Glycosyltransferase n=1 Tax=Arabidopsis arenosa TaxID=38785 RepID=A0A8S1ZRX8_ARAAE|nr:unnamed protein product [Arabidopsis arenosa]